MSGVAVSPAAPSPAAPLTFERQFLVSSHALAIVGALGIALTGEVGLPYVVFALASLLWSAWRFRGGAGIDLDVRIANVAMLVLLVVVALRVFAGDLSPIRGIAEFLLVLLGLKALAPKQDRDWLQIYVLSFFDLVAASALTVELAFAVVFLAYLLLAPWVLTLFHLRREAVQAGEERRLSEEAFVDASLFRGIVGVTLVLFVSTLAVFVVFPRMGAGFFANPFGASSGLSGFSDSVELGDVAALQLDDSVAMRASVDPLALVADAPRYWRGAILDVYDGRQWSRGPHRYRPLDRASRTVFRTDLRRARAPQVREEIILEPMDVPVLPSLGRPIEIRGRLGGVLEDPLGNLRGAYPSGVRLRYDVLAALGPDPTSPTPETIVLPPIDPRIAALAEERTRGIESAAGRAEALLAIFREGFRYSLEPGDPGTADPLARFLFETRYGHCEYFASGLAVLLRAAGIPSRIVNGYHGGEWNEYGGYFVVRQSDAHSWVEAWIDGAWRRLDPSPPATGGLARHRTAAFAAWVDAARMRWYRWVVNYGAADQVEIALSVRDSSRRLWREIGDVSIASLWRSLRERVAAAGPLAASLAAGAVLGGLLLVALARRRGASARAAGVAPGADAYLRLLRALERRGVRRRDSDTPDDVARRAAETLGEEAAPVSVIVALYQAMRFSGDPDLERGARPEVERLLERLG